MARKIMLEGGYAFNPSTRQVVIRRIVPRERLVLITNTTQNKVIYNFSDTALTATAYTTFGDGQVQTAITSASGTGTAVTFTSANSYVPGQQVVVTGVTPASYNGTYYVTAANATTFTVAGNANGAYVSGGLATLQENTVITLNFNTSAAGMLTTDTIQITVDEYSERTRPSEELTDPVAKQRISAPQSLMDTDFEYAKQDSKWETQTTTNFRPFATQLLSDALTPVDVTLSSAGTKTTTVAFTNTTIATTATGVQGNGTTVLYTTASAHNLVVGQWVTITGVTPSGYNTTSGIPVQILEVPSTTTFRTIGSTTGQSTVAGTVTSNVAPPVGTPISITDTFSNQTAGNYVVETRPGETSFTFASKGSTPTGWASSSVFDAAKTIVLQGKYYKDAPISTGAGAMTMTYSGQAITVTTTIPHGLSIGNEIAVVGTTASTNAPNGNFIVSTVNSPTQFIYYAPAAPTGTLLSAQSSTTATASANSQFITVASAAGISIGQTVVATGVPANTMVVGLNGTVVQLSQNTTAALSSTTTTFQATLFARSQAQSVHRAFDGGVMFSSNGQSNNISLIRQTRRYFRYQSGKGIQFSTGTIFKPTYTIDRMTFASGVVTVQTKERHGLQPGFAITIFGANEVGYNGTFSAITVLDQNTFTYIPSTTPTITTASGNYYLAIAAWNGATNRIGMFDQQNGMFWEYDGQTLWVVRRSSIFQISGRVSVTANSSTVTQTSANFPTYFNKQLVPGDWIVIRGQSYKVQDIASDTSLTLSQQYRGATATNVTVSKTVDTRVPQAQFNIDRIDGTGTSGYNIDLSKMQMFYIDYTWYGAGAIRWGFRGPKGDIVYVHKIANNNLNPMAYMRSGNLPARYESSTWAPSTQITSSVGSGDTTINVASTVGFTVPVSISTTATGNSGQATIVVGSATGLINGLYANASNITAGTQIVSISGTTVTLSANNTGAVSGAITFSSQPGCAVIRSGSTYELINYTGVTGNTLTGVTRGAAGNSSLALTIATNSNVATVGSASGLQVGQRVISPAFNDNTFISYIQGTTLILSNAPTSANPTVIVPPAGATSGQSFTYSATAPVNVELAFPTDAPTISHWGSSVIMDGRFDDDKALLFTYGQTASTQLAPNVAQTNTGTASASATVTLGTSTTNLVPGMYVVDGGTAIPRGTFIVSVTSPTVVVLNNTVTLSATSITFFGASSKALMSVRCAPSVDSGIVGNFGTREVLNRMQLMLKGLDLTLTGTTTGNVLVTILLNGTPFNTTGLTATNWTNAIGNRPLTPNSSLAQICDFAGGNVIVQGGEATGGFFTNSTGAIDLSNVRDLGNAILGGGVNQSNAGVYPDGPDTLTIVATNVSTVAQTVQARLSWSEAQA